jgi:integrase
MTSRRRGRGEGSIVQRADGRWMARIDLGFVDGRRLRKQFYAPTRKLVAKKLNDAIGRHHRGAIVATNEQLTVSTYLDQWLSTVSVRPKTKRQCAQVVRLYLKPAVGPVRVARLAPDHVRALVLGLGARGLSA